MTEDLLGQIEALTKERDQLKRERDAVVEFAESIKKWSEAYPTDIFREPDPKKVQSVCESLGCTLDGISAMVLRVFTKPWGDKARAFLARIEQADKETP